MGAPASRTDPRVTVVTVVRNAAAVLPRCLASVARQRGPWLEYLVVDGASTDGTVELLRASAGTVSRWISEPDAGVYDAMNKGVRMASGDFVLFLGADDELVADLAAVAPLLRDPRTIYYGDAYWPALGRAYDGRFGTAKLARRNICQQAIFYPRAVFDRHAFDLRYRWQADWELNMRCHSDPALRFEYLPVLVARYNDVDGASTTQRDLAMETDYPRLLWRHFPAYVALPLAAAYLAGRAARRIGLRTRGAN